MNTTLRKGLADISEQAKALSADMRAFNEKHGDASRPEATARSRFPLRPDAAHKGQIVKSFQQLAQSAYEAYEQEVVKQNGGDPYPWAKLDPGWQFCWVAAVQQVVAEVAS